MKSEKFVYRYRTPDDVTSPIPDFAVVMHARNAFVTRLKLDGRAHEADGSLWSGKVLKQEQTAKNAFAATIIFTKK